MINTGARRRISLTPSAREHDSLVYDTYMLANSTVSAGEAVATPGSS